MKTRIWSLISLGCFLAAILFWLLGNERSTQSPAPNPAPNTEPAHPAVSQHPPRPDPVHLLTRLSQTPAPTRTAPANPNASPASALASATACPPDPRFPWRVRNTLRPLDDLLRRDDALLLRNALLDTASRAPLDLPEHLRANAEPGAYVVQARRPIDTAFRNLLTAQGAQIVSYIPNNAYLVQASAHTARTLAAAPGTRAVLPFEPYFKIEPGLLGVARDQADLPEGAWLNLTAFPGSENDVRSALAAFGAQTLLESPTPFGPQFVVAPTASSLVALAQLPGIQWIESYSARQLSLDLTRVRLAVSPDTTNTSNHFNLTGSNVWVNLNDSGVDSDHPGLQDRVFSSIPLPLTDTNGHGTHLAGIIAGSGQGFPTLTNPPPGSLTNASFRGLAPAAKLFVLPVDLILGPLLSDAYLQETAARTNYDVLGKTNAMVSNNSWNYPARYEYNAAAASYDAAVRDAVPGIEGSQSMVYVFSAGNNGRGNDVGSGGNPGTIASPATAKNVITVGAIENLRSITYELVQTNQVTNIVDDEVVVTNVVQTNLVVLAETDTDWQVASFSGRGNVGAGLEGEGGRFKPDLVAPGTFVISARSEGWDVRTLFTNAVVTVFPDQALTPGETNSYSINIPNNATRLILEVLTNSDSPPQFPPLPFYVRPGDFPTDADFVNTNSVTLTTNGTPPLVPGVWYYDVVNPNPASVAFDLRTIVEVEVDLGKLFETLTNLNEQLAPDYRYDSGTSAAAAGISGLLALVQEYFELQLKQPYSPALLKALLINGARSLGPQYNFQIAPRLNYQGWGLPTLATVLPPTLTNETDQTRWPLQWIDQNPTNALATAQSRTFDLALPETEEEADVRVTLVWTDPPGNPAASLSLVNDLDLVVSNRITGEIYLGNTIPAGSDYTPAVSTNIVTTTNTPANTNATFTFDSVNNVENVFLRRPTATNFAVQVVARRVNVNSVTAHTNGIVQDFALVVSRLGTNAIGLKPLALETNTPPEITQVTNGVELIGQRAGANSPLQNYDAGMTNQWHFYVFTNTYRPGIDVLTNGPYIDFNTYVAANLSTPRSYQEPDIDLYVSRGDPGLLTLQSNALAQALKSVERGGIEFLYVTNAADGEVFYIGVKSEDQMAAEYSLLVQSTQFPGELIDENGNSILYLLPLPAAIPDGTPDAPERVTLSRSVHRQYNVGRVEASVTNIHQRPGDLVGMLTHTREFAVLNNHNDGTGDPPGWVGGIYTDAGDALGTIPTDGPGSLNDFLGARAQGLWQYTAIDNSGGHTGWVDAAMLRISPAPDLLLGVDFSLPPNSWTYYWIDVPPDASLLSVVITDLTGPIEVYLRWEAIPTFDAYDKMARFAPPGGTLDLSYLDSPPLTGGRYYIGLFNPNAYTVNGHIQVRIERNLPPSFRTDFYPTNSLPLGDDVLSVSTVAVDDSRNVSVVNLGLRINHQRISDLAIYLVNPQGDKVLFNENRGGPDRQQYGFDTLATNYHYVALTYSTNTGVAALYLDGVLHTERDVGLLSLQTGYDLILGHKPNTNAPASQFLGAMDEVSLYQRALHPSEILAMYKFGGAGRPTNGIVSRWPLDGTGVDLMTNNPAQVLGPTTVAGRFDAALDFAILADRVWITNGAGLDVGLGAGFTLDAWINPRDLSAERPLAVWSDGTNAAGVEFYIRPGNNTNLPPGELAVRLVGLDGSTNDVVAATQGLIRTNGILTNTVYTTFTDNTNLAFLPIKFGNPATNANYSATNILVSGLEITNPALPLVFFTNTEVFDGWTVVSETAAVLNAPPIAHTGTNLLALQNATLRRTLPTLAGRAYRFQWVNRSQTLPEGIIAWWPGQDSPSDLVGTNHATIIGTETYSPAMVGRGFALLDHATHLRVESNDSLALTNEIGFETWFLCPGPTPNYGGLVFKGTAGAAVNFAAAISAQGIDVWFDDPASTDPQSDAADGRELMRWTKVPSTDAWHHLAMSFRQISPVQVEIQLYLDGELCRSKVLLGTLLDAANQAPLLIGAAPPAPVFEGLVDEPSLYSRALTAAEIREIYLLDALGKRHPQWPAMSRVILDNASSNLFTAPVSWETNSMSFLAATDNTPVVLQALSPGCLFDSFEIVELLPTFFFPEEPTTPLLGSSALGDWRLEVYDRRTGALLPVTPELLDWELKLTFAPRRYPTITLTNGIPYASTIGTGQARFFIVEVPLAAGHATNTLTAVTSQDLWFNQNALPLTDPAGGDIRLLVNTTAGVAVLATNGFWQADTDGNPIPPIAPVPSLVPGQRYYLALTNAGPLQPFTLRVDFDALDTNILGVVPLAFGQTIVTNVAPTNAMQYYRYTVTTNALAASFELHPQDGNANLYIRKARNVRDPLPTTRVYDYASENPSTNSEVIVVSQDSIVPLGSGDWFLGVLSADTNTVHYSIRVVEYSSPTPGAITLVENVPTHGINPSGASQPTYFTFSVTNARPAVQFDLYDLSANAALWTQAERKPSADDYYASDFAAPPAPARLVLRTNPALPSLVGDWMLAVTHEEPAGSPHLTYTVLASFPPATPAIPVFTATTTVSNTLAADTFDAARVPDYYHVVVPSLATNLTLTLTPIDGNTDLVLRRDFLPDLAAFDYISGLPGLWVDSIQIDPGSAPVPLAPGDWYVAVFNQSLNSVTYALSLELILGPAGPSIGGVVVHDTTVSFTWQGADGKSYQVDYATSIPPDGIQWSPAPGTITYNNGQYTFVDDGASTGGFTPEKYYRVREVTH